MSHNFTEVMESVKDAGKIESLKCHGDSLNEKTCLPGVRRCRYDPTTEIR